MNKVTCIKNKNYTAISNVFLRDERLSLKAKGLLALVLTLPDDWEFTIQGIERIVKEGKTSIYSTIDELKEFGYCQVTIQRNEKGVFVGNDYTFFETPNSINPQTGYPYMENPNMDNQPQINKDNNKVKIEEEKEYKEKFATFVKLYKKLTNKQTRGIDTEYKDFKSRHKDWKQVIPFLSIAIERETNERNAARMAHKFFPEPKMLQTYLGKQRAWELYVDTQSDVKEIENEYRPATGGSLNWNDYYNCYVYIGMFIENIVDGYTSDNRPDGATILLNNGRGYIKWDAIKKCWTNCRT